MWGWHKYHELSGLEIGCGPLFTVKHNLKLAGWATPKHCMRNQVKRQVIQGLSPRSHFRGLAIKRTLADEHLWLAIVRDGLPDPIVLSCQQFNGCCPVPVR